MLPLLSQLFSIEQLFDAVPHGFVSSGSFGGQKKRDQTTVGFDMCDEDVRKSIGMDIKELADLYATCKEEASRIIDQEEKKDKDRDKQWLREARKKVNEQEEKELSRIAAKKKAAAEAQQVFHILNQPSLSSR